MSIVKTFEIMIIFLFTFVVLLVLLTAIVWLLGLIINLLNLPSYFFALTICLWYSAKITKSYFTEEV